MAVPDECHRGSFEEALEREVARVLDDPLFQRSPVQSRLLRYLCDQTVLHNRNISQLAVAVDGLGRPEGADQLTESYPRVQISRLRHNLSIYYSRCSPGEGMAVYIRRGDYHLRLAPLDRAYPHDLLPRAPSAVDENEAPTGRNGAPGRNGRRMPLPALVLGAILVAAIAAAAVFHLRDTRGLRSPTLAVVYSGSLPDESPQTIAYHAAGDFAAKSFVVRPADRSTEDGADYTLTVRPDSSTSDLGGVTLLVTNRLGELVFRDSVTAAENPGVFAARLNARLAQIVGPTGVIALREVRRASIPPRSDYECILALEYQRGQGQDVTGRALACLDTFPQSSYRAYWLARAAFLSYRGSVLDGGRATPAGPAWTDLQQALDVDPYNPVANFVTAKVYIASGDCVAARPYVERAIGGGNYYPSLVAAVSAEAGLCPEAAERRDVLSTDVAELAQATPNPDPLLRLYLVFATVALDRPDIARALLAFPASEENAGIMAEPLNTLRDGLSSPTAFAANRARVERVVEGYYWGPATRARLVDKLASAAEGRL